MEVLIAGLIGLGIGVVIGYAICGRKTNKVCRSLVAQIRGLETQRKELEQKIAGLREEIRGLDGLLRSKDLRIQTLERETEALRERSR